jgi:hypothetical protein
MELKHGGKRKASGRKPVTDKKVQVSLYIPTSQIEKFGGIEKFKADLYEFATLRSLIGA